MSITAPSRFEINDLVDDLETFLKSHGHTLTEADVIQLSEDLTSRGKPGASIRLIEAYSRLSKVSPLILMQYAAAFSSTGNYQREREIYAYLLKIGIDHPRIRANLARSFSDSQEHEMALETAKALVAHYPKAAEGYETLGDASGNLELRSEAVRAYSTFLNLQWSDAPSIALRLCTIVDLNAIPSCEAEIELIRGEFKEALLDTLQESPKKIRHPSVRWILAKISRTYLAYHGEDDRGLYELHNETIRASYGSLDVDFPARMDARTKRIGVITTGRYHSALFVDDQIEELISSGEFDVTYVVVNNAGYSNNKITTKTIYVQLTHDTFEPCVTKIRALGLDIAYIPEIGMSIECQLLASQRIARETFTSWLHPITSGSVAVDYFLSPKSMEVDTRGQAYTEKLALTEGIGLTLKGLITRYPSRSADSLSIPAETRDRRRGVRILCLQRPFKVHPRDDEILARLLLSPRVESVTIVVDAIPKLTSRLISRLLTTLKSYDPTCGAIGEKLSVKKRMTQVELHRFLSEVDVAFDIHNWSGGNTTLDCLMMGVPVLTWPGDTMRQNHTAGIYRTIGDSLVVSDLIFSGDAIKDYVERIIDVAVARRDGQKVDFRKMLEETPAFQTASPIADWCCSRE